MAFDDFCMSFAGVVLIAYMSTLTSLGYTATQYALLVSAVNFSGKTLKGFSGAWVKGLARGGRDLTHAYAAYFIDCALVGIPALLLVLALAWVRRRAEIEPVQAS
jgi:PAT family beta-lactamase induction signal transducer AmpG